MPKVCILTTVHHPRDDRIFHKQALSLVEAGYDVALVARWAGEDRFGPVRPIGIQWPGGLLGRLTVGGYRVLRRCLDEDADVYHFHDPELLFVGILLRLIGKRVVYDVHEDYRQKAMARLRPKVLAWVVAWVWRFVEFHASRKFSLIVCADSHIRSRFSKHRAIVVGNYPPAWFVESAGKSALGKDRETPTCRVVYVGGVSYERGIGKAVEALKCLDAKLCELHVAGPIQDEALLEILRSTAGVVYHGLLPWEGVRELLSRCSIGLLPLQSGYSYETVTGEGIIKLWEYLGFGLAVVVPSFPKLRELVEAYDVGLAVDTASPECLANAIRRLCEDSEMRLRLGGNGRRVVAMERNWEIEKQKLLDSYKEILKSGC